MKIDVAELTKVMSYAFPNCDLILAVESITSEVKFASAKH